MTDINDYLKALSISAGVTSARQVAAITESMEEAEKQRKLDEINSPTNQHLKTIIEQSAAILKQSDEQNKLLKEQNENLKKQLDHAIVNEKEARKQSKHDRIWVYISTGIAFASLIATILIAIFK